MSALLHGCRAALDSKATFTWVAGDFLRRRRVEPFQDLPLWLLERDAGFFRVSAAKARSRGLSFRPLAETIRDTYAWDASRRGGKHEVGLAPEREAELLRAWRSRSRR